MAVQTPGYWKEDKFQPLVEVKTAYGSMVKIPKEMTDSWQFWERNKELIINDLERVKAAGYFMKSKRNPLGRDLMRVFFERYHE